MNRPSNLLDGLSVSAGHVSALGLSAGPARQKAAVAQQSFKHHQSCCSVPCCTTSMALALPRSIRTPGVQADIIGQLQQPHCGIASSSVVCPQSSAYTFANTLLFLGADLEGEARVTALRRWAGILRELSSHPRSLQQPAHAAQATSPRSPGGDPEWQQLQVAPAQLGHPQAAAVSSSLCATGLPYAQTRVSFGDYTEHDAQDAVNGKLQQAIRVLA